MDEPSFALDEFSEGLASFQIPPEAGILVHGSTSSLGAPSKNANAILDVLMKLTGKMMMPAFTHQSLVIPEEGPEDNGIAYGSGRESNLKAIIFHNHTPVDESLGDLAEIFRQLPGVERSKHPVLSFAGYGMKEIISTQTVKRPIDAIARLAQTGGWVILLGVDHRENFSIHYAETLVGRRSFKRWALYENGIVECLRFPGCNKGFNAVNDQLERITRQFTINDRPVKAFPLSDMIAETSIMISKDPTALLCDDESCLTCAEIRKSVVQN